MIRALSLLLALPALSMSSLAHAGALEARISKMLYDAQGLRNAISSYASNVTNELARTSQSDSSSSSASISESEAELGFGFIGGAESTSVGSSQSQSAAKTYNLDYSRSIMKIQEYFPKSLDPKAALCDDDNSNWKRGYLSFMKGEALGKPRTEDEVHQVYDWIGRYQNIMYQLSQDMRELTGRSEQDIALRADFKKQQFWGRFSYVQIFPYYVSDDSSARKYDVCGENFVPVLPSGREPLRIRMLPN
jgi:hypothetical protein